MKRTGTASKAETVKAGCGIRYDPEQLGEDASFDFSAAAEMKVQAESDASSEEALLTSSCQRPSEPNT